MSRPIVLGLFGHASECGCDRCMSALHSGDGVNPYATQPKENIPMPDPTLSAMEEVREMVALGRGPQATTSQAFNLREGGINLMVLIAQPDFEEKMDEEVFNAVFSEWRTHHGNKWYDSVQFRQQLRCAIADFLARSAVGGSDGT